MKKLAVLFVAIALLIFFSIPSFLFADEGDTNDATYTFEDTVASDGQYRAKNDITEEIVDVFCIDETVTLSTASGAYTEDEGSVSEILQAEGVVGGGTGIGEDYAVAVEILSTTAVGGNEKLTGQPGGAATENQVAVWDLISRGRGTTSGIVSNERTEAIADAALELAEEFIKYNEDNPEDKKTLQEYLDDEHINELKIVLDEKPLVDSDSLETTDEFIAEAIMENPLVPGVTDEGKTVSWYIMEGSYNVSFSKDELVKTAESIMNDKTDDDSDKDGDGKTDNDHYGYATIPYYFYWWGEGYPEYEEMQVNLFAWVDIDGDEKLDIQDSNVDKVPETPEVIALDTHTQAGGKVLSTGKTDQRFATESHQDPFAAESKTYKAWGSFEVSKTNSVTGLPVAGATYELTYIDGQTYEPEQTVYTLVTGADGKASVANLPWGTYELKEVSAPTGYYIDSDTYTYHIGGNKLFADIETNVLDATGNVTNDPIPSVTTDGGGEKVELPEVPEESVIEVAGISEERAEAADAGVIEVLGISELPFTGSNFILLLAGIFMIFVASTVLVVSKIRQANK